MCLVAQSLDLLLTKMSFQSLGTMQRETENLTLNATPCLEYRGITIYQFITVK